MQELHSRPHPLQSISHTFVCVPRPPACETRECAYASHHGCAPAHDARHRGHYCGLAAVALRGAQVVGAYVDDHQLGRVDLRGDAARVYVRCAVRIGLWSRAWGLTQATCLYNVRQSSGALDRDTERALSACVGQAFIYNSSPMPPRPALCNE